MTNQDSEGGKNFTVLTLEVELNIYENRNLQFQKPYQIVKGEKYGPFFCLQAFNLGPKNGSPASGIGSGTTIVLPCDTRLKTSDERVDSTRSSEVVSLVSQGRTISCVILNKCAVPRQIATVNFLTGLNQLLTAARTSGCSCCVQETFRSKYT